MRDTISSVGYDCCFIVGLCFFMRPSWCCLCFIACWCYFISLASASCDCCYFSFLVVLFDQVTIVVVWSLNQSFLFFVWLSYCYFFGVIRLLIFVFHEIASTFKNLKGSTTKTFTYVKHHKFFFCCHPTTFMHFIFYAESECYDAIISSTPTFSFLVFIKKAVVFWNFCRK